MSDENSPTELSRSNILLVLHVSLGPGELARTMAVSAGGPSGRPYPGRPLSLSLDSIGNAPLHLGCGETAVSGPSPLPAILLFLSSPSGRFIHPEKSMTAFPCLHASQVGPYQTNRSPKTKVQRGDKWPVGGRHQRMSHSETHSAQCTAKSQDGGRWRLMGNILW